MRNPRRTAGPIRRTVVTPQPAPATPAANLLLRPATVVEAPVPVRRTRALPMTGAQRDTNGNRSDWNKPATLSPWTTPMMPAWSYTASVRPNGSANLSLGGQSTR